MKIETIDQEFLSTRETIASYLVRGPDGYLLIETGPASTQETLEEKVTALGVALEDVRHVLVTHIHLDHSGGAGYWARRGSRIYVHPKGARHLINPDKLLASASRIYGDRMDKLWGRTLPVPEELVTVVEVQPLSLAGLEVRGWDTPGHAGHHLAYQIGDQLFTGDVAGCCLPGFRFPSVPAPPPEFNRELWKKSLAVLRQCNPQRLFLTHFGVVDDPGRYLDELEGRMEDCVEFVARRSELSMSELEEAYSAWDREQASQWGVEEADYERYEKANPAFMSAQGIRRYLLS